MSYAGSGLQLVASGIGKSGIQIWTYESTDSLATIYGAAYFSDGADRGMRIGDIIFVVDTDAPAALFCYVYAVNQTTRTASITPGVASGNAGSFTSLTATGDVNLGDAAADLLGFHGATAVSQRASSNQATTNIAVSASFGATQVAIIQEIMNTLAQLGLWKGAA